MELDHHDDKVNDPVGPKQKCATHCATTRHIDYDYQAEQHVADCAHSHDWEVKWVLVDDLGARAIWERREGQPALIAKADRFQGEWVPIEGWVTIPIGAQG